MDDDRFAELRAALGSFDGERRWHDAVLRRAGGVVGGVLAVAAVVVGWSWLRPVDGPAPVDDGSAASLSSVVTSTTAAVVDAPARVWPVDPVEVIGTEVRSGGQRWAVGDAGDLVAVGDWDCDGTSTPAVLRPSEGTVFVFDEWAPADGGRVSSRSGGSAPTDAVSFASAGCGAATVGTAGGGEVTIEVAR